MKHTEKNNGHAVVLGWLLAKKSPARMNEWISSFHREYSKRHIDLNGFSRSWSIHLSAWDALWRQMPSLYDLFKNLMNYVFVHCSTPLIICINSSSIWFRRLNGHHTVLPHRMCMQMHNFVKAENQHKHFIVTWFNLFIHRLLWWTFHFLHASQYVCVRTLEMLQCTSRRRRKVFSSSCERISRTPSGIVRFGPFQFSILSCVEYGEHSFGHGVWFIFAIADAKSALHNFAILLCE